MSRQLLGLPWELVLELPWPPSVNHYYIMRNRRKVLSSEGRKYREKVEDVLADITFTQYTGKVEVGLELYPPDNRTRDIDNYNKCLFDALTHAGLWKDDHLAKVLHIYMRDSIPGGLIAFYIKGISSDAGK